MLRGEVYTKFDDRAKGGRGFRHIKTTLAAGTLKRTAADKLTDGWRGGGRAQAGRWMRSVVEATEIDQFAHVGPVFAGCFALKLVWWRFRACFYEGLI